VPVILVDDVLLAPFRGLLWIFQEIHRAAQEEMVSDAESITAELSTLYMRLETGKITEQEFAEQEKVLLDRLDKIQRPERMIE
jgi:hypothetical protein